MPNNPLFLLFLAIIIFVVISLVISPLFYKDRRDRLEREIDEFYNVNKTKKKKGEQ